MNENMPHVLKWKWVYFPLTFIVFSIITNKDGQLVIPSITCEECFGHIEILCSLLLTLLHLSEILLDHWFDLS